MGLIYNIFILPYTYVVFDLAKFDLGIIKASANFC